MKIFLINLDCRPKRLEAFRTRQKVNGWRLPEVEVFTASVPRNVKHYWWRSSPGAWGCRSSHISVLHNAKFDDVLILEDDIIWENNWPALFEFLAYIPDDWDCLMLGGQHHETPQEFKGYVRCLNTTRTHAYIVRNRFISTMVDIYNRADCHIDNFFATEQSCYRVYAPYRFFFGQAKGISDSSCHRRREDMYWND